MKKIIIVILVLACGVAAYVYLSKNKVKKINSFQSCADAGNPIQESFPRVCQAGNESFSEQAAPEPKAAISIAEAVQVIDNCEAVGTYSVHNGTVGLILKNDTHQPVAAPSEDYLRSKENKSCPFTQAAME